MTMTKTAKTTQKAKIAKQKKAQKAQKKAIAEKVQKNRFGFMGIFVLVLLITLFFNQTRINWVSIGKNNEKLNMLEETYNHERIQTEYMQQKSDAPIDDEYIREIAKTIGYEEADAMIYCFNESD